MKHVTEAKTGEVCYMGLRDIFNLETSLKRDTRSGAIHICVDNGRAILEEVLTARFGVPIKIDFMSLEA